MPRLTAPLLDDPYIQRTSRNKFYWYERLRGHFWRVAFAIARPVTSRLRQRDERRRQRKRAE